MCIYVHTHTHYLKCKIQPIVIFWTEYSILVTESQCQTYKITIKKVNVIVKTYVKWAFPKHTFWIIRCFWWSEILMKLTIMQVMFLLWKIHLKLIFKSILTMFLIHTHTHTHTHKQLLSLFTKMCHTEIFL